MKLTRFPDNPILLPSLLNPWEAAAAFNGSITTLAGKYVLVYRAQAKKSPHAGENVKLSTVGLSISQDKASFQETRLFISPEEEWERFGCEDPRVTKLEDTYYIFYTALANYPYSAGNIKVAVALTKDFQTITEKHLVTPFNAKAMTLFPEKINGKYAALLTADTDLPPAKIALALFDSLEEMWSQEYWEHWYQALEEHELPVRREESEQIEVGAPPIKTEKGWLLIYSSIKNYFSENKVFGIEAILLDLNDPKKILSRTTEPLLVPETEYEKYGNVPQVIFPTGAIVENGELSVYYGGADTTCCLATCSLDTFLSSMEVVEEKVSEKKQFFTRFVENPILTPVPGHSWEDMAVFNAGVIDHEEKIYILYRAHGYDLISTVGYARSDDGYHIINLRQAWIFTPFFLDTFPWCIDRIW